LQQVIWNLLSNAVKFTDPGGSILVAIRQEGSSVILTVADTGRGIEPEFLPYVFDRFQQADGSTTRRFGGLGLGLALVRHIVELHGGSVAVESAGPGTGATFSITLPIRALVPEPAHARSVPAPLALEKTTPASMEMLGGLRVLIVDDEPDALDLLSTVLVQAGAEVQAASSVEQAVETLQAFRPQLLISDIGMPGEDGYSLVRRVRALSPGEGGAIPSIALTAYTRSEDRAKALAAGFTTHIGKPVTPVDLLAAVANLASFIRR
jgi:CheY-like chemotaxis protein